MLIVTDTAVDLPAELETSTHIRIAGGMVRLDDQVFSGNTPAFWQAVRSGARPTTAPPSLATLTTAYTADQPVLAIHASAELSATVAHATDAARRFPGSVTVVDSRSIGPGAGLVVAAAHRAAQQGEPPAQVAALAAAAAAKLHTFALIDDPEWLSRSGRSGLSSDLHRSHRHPLVLVLALRGRAVILDRAKHRNDAVRHLAAHAEAGRGHAGYEWALCHGDAADIGKATEQIVSALGQPPTFCRLLGPTVGAHVGPGAILVGVLPTIAAGQD